MPKRKQEPVDDDVSEEEVSPKKAKAKPRAKAKKDEQPTEPYVDDNGWNIHPPSLIYRNYDAEPGKKIAAFDLDGTLTNTKSGAQFPRNADDWKFYNKKVPQIIKKYHEDGYTIVIFSNQGGIKSKLVGPMADKTKARLQNVIGKLGVPAQAFMATLEDDFRKPGTGMWDFFCSNCNGDVQPDLKGSFFVGDAAGRPADFSDSDKKFAESIGIPFKVPEDVFGEMEGKRALPTQVASGSTENQNEALTDVFTKLAEHYTSKGDGFKARAYSNVVGALRSFPAKIEQSNLKEVSKLKGVGKASLNIIKEFIETGKSAFLEEVTGEKVDEEARKEAKAAADTAKNVALNFM